MYGYKCEHCQGTVREQLVRREAFKHRNGFVILENVPIGVCDICGYRYYHASLLHRVEDIASGKHEAQRTEQVPVAAFA
jgi:YgiT-type zinc finger domain-containing protein